MKVNEGLYAPSAVRGSLLPYRPPLTSAAPPARGRLRRSWNAATVFTCAVLQHISRKGLVVEPIYVLVPDIVCLKKNNSDLELRGSGSFILI